MNKEEQLFAPVRRIVTGHTPQGKSIISTNERIAPMFFSEKSKVGIYTTFVSTEIPSKIDQDIQFVQQTTQFPKFCQENGCVFRVFDYAPKSKSPFHRTNTIDYGTVIKGSLSLELDEGKTVLLQAGDTFVQRGTNHAWINESLTDWARVSFVIIREFD